MFAQDGHFNKICVAVNVCTGNSNYDWIEKKA